jgi:hypothetical protein
MAVPRPISAGGRRVSVSIPNWLRAAAVVGILFLYLWPRYFFVGVAGRGVSGYTAITMLLLAGSFAALALSPPLRIAYRGAATRSWVVLAMFALLWVWRIAADSMGLTPIDSYRNTGLDFLYLGSWLIIASILFLDRRLQSTLPYLIAISGIIATLFGLLEFATGRPVSDLLGFYDFAVGDQYMLSNLDAAQMRGQAMRVKSLYAHPIVYGQFVASMLPIALHFILQRTGWQRILGAALSACVALSLYICNARSPLFVAVAGGAIYLATFYVDIRRGSRLFVAAWLGIALLIVAPMATGYLYSIASGRTSEEAMSTTARRTQKEKGHDALVARPLNGFGDGSSLAIAGLKGRNNVMTVDDYYLTVSVDDGYVGLALFIALLACISLKGVLLTVRERGSEDRSLNGAYTAAAIALAVGLNILSIYDGLSIIYLFAGALIARSKPAASSGLTRSAFPIRPGTAGVQRSRTA